MLQVEVDIQKTYFSYFKETCSFFYTILKLTRQTSTQTYFLYLTVEFIE